MVRRSQYLGGALGTREPFRIVEENNRMILTGTSRAGRDFRRTDVHGNVMKDIVA